MHRDHPIFIDCLHQKRKVRLIFFSLEDQRQLTRTCAPMDYGPNRRAKVKSDRYHLWNYDSDQKTHVLSLQPEQIIRIEQIEESFDPAEFVTWDTTKSIWFVSRDWGRFS